MKKKKELLDEIVKITGYLYLSDLHNPCNLLQTQKAVDMIKEGSYSEKEWQEAFYYITGLRIFSGTEIEIRKRLKKIREDQIKA